MVRSPGLPLISFALVLASAVLHATWNLILKGTNDRLVAAWALNLVGGVVFLPVLVAGGLPVGAWPYAVSSAVVEVLYFLALSRSYQRADFSTTYPIARGLAPPLVAVLAFAFLEDRLHPLQLLALLVVSAGVLMVAFGSVRSGGIRWAAATGVLIAVYTSIDGAGVRATGESFRYTILLFWLASSIFLPIVLQRRGWSGIVASVRLEGWRYVAAGVASVGAYSLVLVAARSAPLGVVAAIREMSVVFGALAGWLLLKEPIVTRRLAGTVVITVGVAGLALL